MALMICVRCPTSRSRVRNTTADACLASLLTATNRMVGRWAASQIASASAALFFCRVLLPLDERLHVSRRNQPHLVPQLGDLACPVVSARARLHGHKTARLRGEEGEHLIAPQLLAEQDRAGDTCRVCLEQVLGQIQSDRANFCHGRLPSSGGQHHHFGTSMPSGGVHSITPLELWWQDEARVGQKNKIARRWARRGTRPRAPHDQRTSSVYIFGAICPQEGKGAALVLPRCDTQAMSLHLAEVAQAVAAPS